MSFPGKITRWDADRGFGFVQTGAPRALFFHIRDYRGATPPAVGMAVEVASVQDGAKGPRATLVTLVAASGQATATSSSASTSRRTAAPAQRGPRPGRTPAPPRATAGAALWWCLLLVWLCALGWGVSQQRIPLWALGALVGLNLFNLLVYALDKSAAQRGAWRVSERNLHLLALAGAWPSAWWAQQLLRHKSSKESFRTVYWLCVLANTAAVGLYAVGWLQR